MFSRKSKAGTKRPNEMWISNNRVLVGGNKKITGRNPNFDTEETKVLISLWGDPKVQKTLITTHKKHAVIAKLAEKMREYGYYRSPEEINTRIKNLKCFYNRIKKDMEFGIATEPTWKHYAAMDEIMTRPIFSVRPNEIPKPSLRYRLEEEMKEREEKEKEREREKEKEKAEKSMKIESDDETDEDDDDDDIDDDLDDVSFTQEMYEEEVPSHEEEKKPKKEEQINSNDVEETPLIIPKEEPIDVDDEPEDINGNRDNSNDTFPKLSAYLQVSSNSITSNENKNTTTIAGSNHGSDVRLPSTSSPTNTIKISQQSLVASPKITTVFANQQTPISTQAGKISLIPTNLLLKPQPQQQIQLRSQPQHRIIYTKPTVQPSSGGIVTSAGAASSGQQVPMKVLLVNTLQKSTANTNVTTATIDSQLKTTNANITLQQNNVTRTATNSNSGSNMQEKRQKLSSASSKSSKEGTSFRTLLSQLVRLQSQNLDVNKQRLEIERERFEFEKTIAEKLINAFIPQQPAASPNQSLQPQTQTSPVINDITVPLLIPKVEKQDDGYEN